MTIPSGGSAATIGAKRCSIQNASRSSASASAIGSASWITRAVHQRLGLGRGHADAQSGGLGRHVRRQHHPPPPIPAHQDERRLRRRRCIARLPPDPIGGQGRQEDGDDPWHRTPPIRNPRSRRRGSGSVPPASARGRHLGQGAALTAEPRPASAWSRLSAGRNRTPRSVASTDAARCRSFLTLRPRVEAAARQSWAGARPPPPRRRGRRAADLLQSRRGWSSRRRLRDR